MARSTYGVYLMKGSGTGSVTYTKLVDIKSFGDLGGAPEQLDTTTLSDSATTSILGIQQMDTIECTANYTKTDFETLKELEGTETPFAFYFDANPTGTPTGDDGKFTFTGMLSVYVVGGGVNEVVDMNISIAASTPITFDAGD